MRIFFSLILLFLNLSAISWLFLKLYFFRNPEHAQSIIRSSEFLSWLYVNSLKASVVAGCLLFAINLLLNGWGFHTWICVITWLIIVGKEIQNSVQDQTYDDEDE